MLHSCNSRQRRRYMSHVLCHAHCPNPGRCTCPQVRVGVPSGVALALASLPTFKRPQAISASVITASVTQPQIRATAGSSAEPKWPCSPAQSSPPPPARLEPLVSLMPSTLVPASRFPSFPRRSSPSTWTSSLRDRRLCHQDCAHRAPDTHF